MAAGESSVLPVMRIYFNISVIIGVKSISVLIFRALLACQIDSHTEAKSWRETSVSEQRTAANENIALWRHTRVCARVCVCVCVYTVVRQERLLGNSSIIFPPGLWCPRRSAALLRWHWAHFGIEKWCIRPQRHCRTSLPPSSQTASLRWCSNNPSNGLRHAPSLSGLHAISTGTDY